jgi:hypothetical protein
MNATNPTTTRTLTLQTLTDSPFGSITSVHDDVVATTCSVPQTLEPEGGDNTYTCTFSAIVPSLSSPQTDTVTAELIDGEDEPIEPDPSDSATVIVNLNASP